MCSGGRYRDICRLVHHSHRWIRKIASFEYMALQTFQQTTDIGVSPGVASLNGVAITFYPVGAYSSSYRLLKH